MSMMIGRCGEEQALEGGLAILSALQALFLLLPYLPFLVS